MYSSVKRVPGTGPEDEFVPIFLIIPLLSLFALISFIIENFISFFRLEA